MQMRDKFQPYITLIIYSYEAPGIAQIYETRDSNLWA